MKMLNLLSPLPPKPIFKKASFITLSYLQSFLRPDNYLKLFHFCLHAEVPNSSCPKIALTTLEDSLAGTSKVLLIHVHV
jgi:hypothetical protein